MSKQEGGDYAQSQIRSTIAYHSGLIIVTEMALLPHIPDIAGSVLRARGNSCGRRTGRWIPDLLRLDQFDDLVFCPQYTVGPIFERH